MKITVLADNTASPGFEAEWGLCFALTLDGPGKPTWLWDAGQSGLFLRSAKALGVDVSQAAGLALSHGHYDHTGGLEALFNEGFSGPVFGHEDIVLTRYHVGDEVREIGIPGLIPEFVRVHSVTKLDDGLRMIADIPRIPGNLQAVDNFYLDREGARPDGVADDACLVAETSKGLVLILGCCHSGLANTLACLADRLGAHRFHAILGGLHLYNASNEAREETARAIEQSGASLVAAGHCTGDKALAWLKSHLRCKVEPLRTGLILNF